MAEAALTSRGAEETARAAFDAFMAHDIDALLSNWHPEGIQDWIALGIFRGHDEIRELFTGLFAAMPDLQMTVEAVTADERRCVIQWRSSGTHTGSTFLGI